MSRACRFRRPPGPEARELGALDLGGRQSGGVQSERNRGAGDTAARPVRRAPGSRRRACADRREGGTDRAPVGRAPRAARCAGRGPAVRGWAGSASSGSITAARRRRAAGRGLRAWGPRGRGRGVVAQLAGGLGDEQAAVAGGAMEEALFVLLARPVLGADRVVGAELGRAQRGVLGGPRCGGLLDKAAERPLCVRARPCRGGCRSGLSVVRVDALADRTCRVAAAHARVTG